MTRRDELGITLVELVIGIAIVGMILSTTGMTLVSILRTTTQTQDQLSATHQLRTGFFWLNQDTQSGVATQATVTPGDVTMQWTDYSTGSVYSSRFQQVGTELQRTITVAGLANTHVIARNVVTGGFSAAQSGNTVTYSLTVQQGSGTMSRSEASTMRVDDTPNTPFPTVTSSPTSTFTPTPTPTDTPTFTPTFTPASCTNSSTGYLSPSSNAADTGGDGDGLESTPANAYADGGAFATNDGGDGDRHRYYTYGINLPAGCNVTGIALRLDYWLKNTGGASTIDAELSWDGGTSWTTAKTDGSEPTSETAVILGSSSDTWGRSWTGAEFSDANFRVRVTMHLGNSGQEVYLDWIPINIYYAPPPTATPTPTDTPTSTFTPSNTPTPTDTPTITPTFTPSSTPTPALTCSGLSGDYYNNTNFTSLALTRIDGTVDFDWASGAPDPAIGADTFSVRWTGYVIPLYSQTYTFYTQSDDGVRLWVDGTQIVDNWTDHATTENSGTIALTAGVSYTVQMDFYENGGAAVAKLSWSSASQAKQIIPLSRLCYDGASASPTSTATPTNTATPTPTNTNTPTPTSTPGGWFATGSYTGDGTDNRDITGVGFQPDIVIVRYDNNTAPVIRTSDMPADRAKRLSANDALQANYIQSFLADGFQVGSDSNVNNSGRLYHWVAMKAGTNVQIGTYTGNAADNRNITGAGFQPDWVMTMADNEQDVFRPGPVAGDASFLINGGGASANKIQSILADGFQVGSHSDVNRNGRTYYWIAFDATANVNVGTYTGNGVDNRNITGLGITPNFAWVKRSVSSEGVWRTDTVSGDRTLYWDAGGPTSNRIQSLLADGFQVGTHSQVNSNGSTYYYLALTP